jgi:hypothetical protein
MLGFLVKLVIIAAIVTGILFYVAPKLKSSKTQAGFTMPKLTDIKSVGSDIKNLNLAGIGQQLSQTLDNLVTHTNRSPVVLGVQITDTSLDTVVNLIRNLPPDQFSQIKSFVCQSASPSAN